MKSEIFFSLIMPVYNDERNISKAIQSIINQTYKNWELIIVDDGSIDNSYTIAKKYASKNKKIKLYKMKRNMGAPVCMNFGTRKARYGWIGVIDSDATEPKDWLKKANGIVKESIDVFGGGVNYIRNKDLSYLQNTLYYIESGLFRKKRILYNLKNFTEPQIAGANFFYTKNVFNNLKGFDVTIRAGYDRLFICQAIERGFNVLYTSHLLINHDLYNWKKISDFFKRTTNFTKWKNIAFKNSKLLEKPYIQVPKLLITLFLSITILLFVFGLIITLIILGFGLIILFIYRFIKIKRDVPIKYLPTYILLDTLKKIIASFVYIFKLKPRSSHWK